MISLDQINPSIPQVKIKLDKERTLVYTNWSYIKFEQEMAKYYGKKITLPAFLNGLQDEKGEVNLEELGVIDLTVLLWSGLIIEDPKLSIEYIANYISLPNFQDVMNTVMEAFGGSVAPVEENNAPLEQEEETQRQ